MGSMEIAGGGSDRDRTGLAQYSLINGNLQGKYAFLAIFVNFQAEEDRKFSALDANSLRKLAGNFFTGSGNKSLVSAKQDRPLNAKKSTRFKFW
jgi:hypothetical protein